MNSIAGQFKITVNGQPVANVVENGEDQIHALLGPDAAIFTLVSGRLQCGDWYLARSLIEDRSLLPKRVYWFRKEHINVDLIHLVSAQQDGDSHSLLFAGMSCEGHVYKCRKEKKKCLMLTGLIQRCTVSRFR